MYSSIFASCPCGCNQSGWFVCSLLGWRSQYAVNSLAAQTACIMLNEGRISEEEVNAMWSVSDWAELVDDVLASEPQSAAEN